MIKIGIECENIEDKGSRYGVGQITLNLLKEYASNIEWQNKYKFYLYFKCEIPNDEFLKNPVFIKRVLKSRSFNLFYHALMPIRAMFDRVDWMFFPAYQLPPLYLGKSIVMLTQDVYYEYKHGQLPFRYRLSYRIFTNWAAKFATKILAISESSKKEVSKLYGINPDKIFVSRLGVEVKPVSPRQDNYILYVGQMFPRRHAKESILAFQKISAEFPDLKFILLGKDKYNPPVIDSLIKDKNKIIHYDYLEDREEVESLYAGARLLIYVSDNEAFGLPPVEAARYNVPVVVKDDDLNHELFEDAAFFVKDPTSDAIAEAMREGLNNEDKRNYCIEKYKKITPGLNWNNFADNFFKNI